LLLYKGNIQAITTSKTPLLENNGLFFKCKFFNFKYFSPTRNSTTHCQSVAKHIHNQYYWQFQLPDRSWGKQNRLPMCPAVRY